MPLKWLSLALMVFLILTTLVLSGLVVFEGETLESIQSIGIADLIAKGGLIISSAVVLCVLLWIAYYAFYVWRSILAKKQSTALILISVVVDALIYVLLVPGITNFSFAEHGILPIVMLAMMLLDLSSLVLPKYSFTED